MRRLRRHVVIRFPDGRNAVAVGKQGCFLSSEEMAIFDKFRRNALLTLTPSSLDSSFDPSAFDRFLDLVTRNGWVCEDPSPAAEIERSTSIDAVESALAMWKPLLKTHDLFREIQRTRAAALLYLTEKTWFVSQASFYLGEAIRHSSGLVRETFIEIERFERDHYKPLVESLGLNPEQLMAHDPHVTSRLLVSHLHSMAVHSPMALLASLALFEGTDQMKADVLASYSGLETLTGLDLSPFKEHFLLDLQEGHESLWKDVFATSAKYRAQEISIILDHIHTTKHAIQTWRDALFSEARKASALPRSKAKDFIRPRARFELPLKMGG